MPICAFSGHRPEKLPWGSNELDPRCVALKIQMKWELKKLCESGVLGYVCGMARGADQYFAEALLELKTEYPLTLEAAVPCPSQPDRWTQEERRKYLRLLAQCDRVTTLEDHYSEGCMLRRNRYMVEKADLLMTVYDGTVCGTGSTVAYAKGRGVKILALWR